MRNVMLVLLLLNAGCSSWPDAGTGGGDGIAIIAEPTYLSAVKHKRHAALLAQTEVLDAQVQLLILQGAQQCVPAAVLQLQQLGVNVRRELGGSLFTDAATDLVTYQHLIRQVQWRFDRVRQQTQCATPASLTDQNTVVQTPGVQNIALFTILFDSDSADIGPGYLRHVELIVQLLKQCHCEVLLVGHTDQKGDDIANVALSSRRVDAVERLLQQYGVTRIARLANGEQEPLLRQFSDQPLNRRVDLLVRPLDEAKQSTPSQDVSLLLKQWGDAGVTLQ